MKTVDENLLDVGDGGRRVKGDSQIFAWWLGCWVHHFLSLEIHYVWVNVKCLWRIHMEKLSRWFHIVIWTSEKRSDLEMQIRDLPVNKITRKTIQRKRRELRREPWGWSPFESCSEEEKPKKVVKKDKWEKVGKSRKDWCQRTWEGDSFEKGSIADNVKSKETLHTIRTKKHAEGVTLEIVGDLGENSLYDHRGQKPDLNDLENKWQLNQKRWQPLGTFGKAHMGENQREVVTVKEYVGFQGVAWVGVNASRNSQ